VSTAAILVAAIMFLMMGGYGLLSPSALIRPFGIALPTAAGRAEVRAVYGGFGVAVAVLLALSGLNVGGIRTGAVTAVDVALIGMQRADWWHVSLNRCMGSTPSGSTSGSKSPGPACYWSLRSRWSVEDGSAGRAARDECDCGEIRSEVAAVAMLVVEPVIDLFGSETRQE